MPHYYARFHPIPGNALPSNAPSLTPQWLRYDTRIYLNPSARVQPNDRPMARIVAKNPGSAMPPSGAPPGTLAPLVLGHDKLLPSVLNAFTRALAIRAAAGLPVPHGNYIQVCNLFYVCDPCLAAALRLQKLHSPQFDPAEKKSTGIPTWFAWGGDVPSLNGFKGRFLTGNTAPSIYWDYSTERTELGAPGVSTSVKHPQGMPLTLETNENFLKRLASIL